MRKTPTTVFFYSLPFHVTGDVLTPRLETECLLRKTIESVRENASDLILDVWTGSGILAICLKKKFPEIPTYWFDVSEKALEIAQENGKLNQVEVIWKRSDLLSALHEENFSVRFPFFIANLPYIKTGDPLVGEDVRLEDPEIALYGGDETWYEMIERFLSESKSWAESTMVERLRIMIEFGHDQCEAISQLARDLGFEYEPFSDYSGIPRFLSLSYVPRSF